MGVYFSTTFEMRAQISLLIWLQGTKHRFIISSFLENELIIHSRIEEKNPPSRIFFCFFLFLWVPGSQPYGEPRDQSQQSYNVPQAQPSFISP